MKHKEITDKIINAFYQVYNTLGHGFLEKIYENAICIELSKQGLRIERQKKILVYYEGLVIGEYYTDITVEDVVICELKTKESIGEADEKQLINYLRSTNLEVGILLNFGRTPEVKRKIYDNDRKSWSTIRTTR